MNIILLAAGQGSRMGAPNKLLLPLGESTVLETTLDALRRAAIGPIYVVTGHLHERVTPLLAARSLPEVYNSDYQSGMTSSIQAGVRAAKEEGGYMICLADMPLISAAAYRLLQENFARLLAQDERAILLPRFENTKGNPVLFAPAYRDEILQHPEPEGCKGIVQANAAHLHWIEMPDDGVLRDLDTPEDYRKIL